MRIPQTEGMFLYEYGELYVEMTGRIYLLFAEASRKAPYPWNPLSCQTKNSFANMSVLVLLVEGTNLVDIDLWST